MTMIVTMTKTKMTITPRTKAAQVEDEDCRRMRRWMKSGDKRQGRRMVKKVMTMAVTMTTTTTTTT